MWHCICGYEKVEKSEQQSRRRGKEERKEGKQYLCIMICVPRVPREKRRREKEKAGRQGQAVRICVCVEVVGGGGKACIYVMVCLISSKWPVYVVRKSHLKLNGRRRKRKCEAFVCV